MRFASQTAAGLILLPVLLAGCKQSSSGGVGAASGSVAASGPTAVAAGVQQQRPHSSLDYRTPEELWRCRECWR